MATESVNLEDGVARVASVAKQFIQTCQTVADPLIDEGDNATGFIGFAYGVVDAMGQRAGLDEAQTKSVLEDILSQIFNGDSTRIRLVMALIATLPNNTAWVHSINIGGTAAVEFLHDGRFSACLALRKMLEAS